MKTTIRYFRARQYVHASLDGRKTLCGQYCGSHGSHWESSLWEEVDADYFAYSPCLRCKKKKSELKQVHVTGKQAKLFIQKEGCIGG